MSKVAKLTRPTALALWEAALAAEIGIAIPIEFAYFDRAKNEFYDARKGREDLQEIMMCPLPEDDEIWLVKKSVEVL